MDKKEFLNLFRNYDEYILSNLWNFIELSEDIEFPVFTNEFYPPLIWSKLEKLKINGIKFLSKGLTEDSEKKIIMCYPENYKLLKVKFPIIYFKIDARNKFAELHHKDFLGTMMSIGIKREIMGDLVVKNNICFAVILDEKYDIIKKIEKIKNISVVFEKIEAKEVPKIEFKSEFFLIASVRIDNFVSSITGLSRQKSVDEITKGNILINYNIIKEKSKEIKEGDIITIKKIGKFKFDKINGQNKKNKIRIVVKRFV